MTAFDPRYGSRIDRRGYHETKHVRKLAKREIRREDRRTRRAEREAAGISGPSIDWDAAVTGVTDTPYEGVAKTLSRGAPNDRK